MKHLLLTTGLLALSGTAALAQSVRVGTAGTPDASAALDVAAPNKGLLAPRLTATARAAIASPAAGLLVYQTDGVQPGFWYYEATNGWTSLAPGSGVSAGTAWVLGGNAGTTPGTHFLGTTDNQDVVFKVNNVETMRLKPNGALWAGVNTTNGGNSVLIGVRAGQAQTTGEGNTYVGFEAGKTSNGIGNTLLGYQAGVLSTGSVNTAVGAEAGLHLSTGENNTLLGADAGGNLTTGSRNTALGRSAGTSMGAGTDNVYVGHGSGATATGSGNTTVGTEAAKFLSTGTGNTTLGFNAGFNLAAANYNVFLGYQSGFSATGTGNTAVGTQAAYALGTGSYNTTLGMQAGTSMAAGSFNVYMGVQAGYFAAGDDNTAIGVAAGNGLTTGSRNTALGRSAGTSMATATDNVYVGYGSGNDATGSGNTGLGRDAGRLVTTGANNTYLGINTGTNNRTGSNNTYVGNGANAGGGAFDNATALGTGAVAGASNVLALGGTGTSLVRVGLGTATPLSRLSITPGSVEAKITLYDGGSTTTHYGFGISGNQLNYHVDGVGSRHVFYAGGKNGDGTELMRVQGNGNVGIGTNNPGQKLHVVGNICYTGSIGACSDGRYKQNVEVLPHALANVLNMRGVSYYWRRQEFPAQHFTADRQIGFIAQEVEKLYPEMVLTGADGYKSVDYAKLTPVLVEAIKELAAQNQQLQADLSQARAEAAQNQQAQTTTTADLAHRLQALEALLGTRADGR